MICLHSKNVGNMEISQYWVCQEVGFPEMPLMCHHVPLDTLISRVFIPWSPEKPHQITGYTKLCTHCTTMSYSILGLCNITIIKSSFCLVPKSCIFRSRQPYLILLVLYPIKLTSPLYSTWVWFIPQFCWLKKNTSCRMGPPSYKLVYKPH